MLIDIYKGKAGLSPLFSVILDIDFYDGPTEAICKLVDTEKWVICSLVYIDFTNRQRIFSMLEVGEQWLSELRPLVEKYKSGSMDSFEAIKSNVEFMFDNYKDDAYLFKSDSLRAKDYEIVQVPIEYLKYFRDIEEVIEQDDAAKSKWIGFFRK
jgi:hypothetical protein